MISWEGEFIQRDELFQKNLPLVQYFVRRYEKRGVDKEDLFQAGCLGLLHALRKYDPERSKISTYASFWIRLYLTREIYYHGHSIKIPAGAMEVLYKFNKGQVNDEKEFSKKVGKLDERSRDKILSIVRVLSENKRVDQEIPNDKDCSLNGDLMDTPIEDNCNSLEADIERQLVLKGILIYIKERHARLEKDSKDKTRRLDRDFKILKHLFGVGGESYKNKKELSNEFGVGLEAIRILENKAIDVITKMVKENERRVG